MAGGRVDIGAFQIQGIPARIISAATASGMSNTAGSHQVRTSGSPGVRFSLSWAPRFVSMTSSGLIRWNASMMQAGTYRFTIVIDNGFGQPTTQVFTLVIGRNPRVTPMR